MADKEVWEAAEIIGLLRQAPAAFAGLPDACRPADEATAYEIQDALHQWLTGRGYGRRVGYKIGCTTPVMQRFMDIDHPCAGGIFEARLFDSPAKIERATLHGPGIECEIAVELGSDLDGRGQIVGHEEASAAVAALYPAIEVVDNRYRDIMAIGTPALIADDFCQSAVVLGRRVSDWRGRDLGAVAGRTMVNGEDVGEGRGADILGHPFNALVWLAGNLADRDRVLEAGEIILLGSLVQCQWLEPGDAAAIEIEGLGGASVQFIS